MFIGTAMGAMGAHALKDALAASDGVQAWDTAVLYHLVHGLAVLIVGAWRAADPKAGASRLLGSAVVLWSVGIFLFSGSLYVLALGGPGWIGPVTPMGGLSLLASWVLVAIAALRTPSAARSLHPRS